MATKLNKLTFPIDKISSGDDEETKVRKIGRNFTSTWQVLTELKNSVKAILSQNYLVVLQETDEYIVVKGKQGNVKLLKG